MNGPRRWPRAATARSGLEAARWPYALALLLGLAWAVLAHAPASWAAPLVERLSARHLLLCDTEGDWLDGSARVVLSAGPDARESSVLPGVLHWSIGLRQLWRGAVELRLRWPGTAEGALNWRASLGLRSWRLRQLEPQDWRAAIPANLLQGLGTPWNTVAPQGRLQLQLRQVILESAAGRLQMQGSLRIDALDLASRMSTVSPLGSYRIDIAADGPSARLDLSTRSGVLLLAGGGVWNDNHLQFSGTARAAPGHEQALATLLGLLGQPEGDHVRIAL